MGVFQQDNVQLTKDAYLWAALKKLSRISQEFRCKSDRCVNLSLNLYRKIHPCSTFWCMAFASRVLPSIFSMSVVLVHFLIWTPCQRTLKSECSCCETVCHKFIELNIFYVNFFLRKNSVIWFFTIRFFSSDFLLLDILPLGLKLVPFIFFTIIDHWSFDSRIFAQ